MGGDERSPLHLTMDGLRRLLRGELPDAEAEALIAHLEESCDDCEVLLAPVVLGLLDPRQLPEPVAGAGDEPDPYAMPVARSIRAARNAAAALAQARVEVREQIRYALAYSYAPEPTDNSPERRWACCELLIEATRQRHGSGLAGALEIAQIAVFLAEDLADTDYPWDVLADLRARAWAELGNARRMTADLAGAESALCEALERYERGTHDPLLLARVLDLLGSLFRAERRFADAQFALDGAYQLYLQADERHFAGRVLIKSSLAFLYAGEPEAAIGSLGRALPLLELSLQPELLVATVQNALLALVDAGETAVAASLLWRCRPLYSALGTPLDRVRLLGLEAKVTAAQGHPARAERLFREVIAKFDAAKLAYDVALVSLELVNVLLDLGRTADAIELVDDMLETFRALNVHREAFMTVLMLRRALEQGRASVRLVRRIAGRLRRLEHGFVQRG